MKKSILVIGAGGGVGHATAQSLLARGDAVIATVSRRDKVESFNAGLPGCREVIAIDLANGNDLRAALEELTARLDGPLDAVIVCAGVSPLCAAELTPLDLFRATMEVNCVAALAIYQATIPVLRLSRGRLVFISSMAGKFAAPLQSAYVASKFALEGLADTLRQEAAPWGVEVIILQPGGIDTPMAANAPQNVRDQAAALREPARSLYGNLYRQVEYRIGEVLEYKRMVSPETVAEAALHAIDTPEPLTRYRIGSDAEQFLSFARTASDRELDELILSNYRSAPS